VNDGKSELIRTSAASGVSSGIADIANGFLIHEIPFRDEKITRICRIQIAYVVKAVGFSYLREILPRITSTIFPTTCSDLATP
jgi:hypothetical protein